MPLPRSGVPEQGLGEPLARALILLTYEGTFPLLLVPTMDRSPAWPTRESKVGLPVTNTRPHSRADQSRACPAQTVQDCKGSVTFPDALPPGGPESELPEANGHLPGI